MFEFVKMWLLLRALDEQEDWEMEQSHEAPLKYRQGLRQFTNEGDFVAAISNQGLWQFWFPMWLRRATRRRSPVEYGGLELNRKKFRKIYRLFDEGRMYITHPNEEKDDDENEKVHKKGLIRLAHPKEDKRPVFVTSYMGGLNVFLKAFPEAWGFVLVSLVPWLYTQREVVCNIPYISRICLL